MTSGLARIGTKRLFVEDTAGDKPAVVFVHGLGATTTFYEPLVPSLEGGFRLVRYDFDGHGRSPLTGPITVPDLARDLGALIATLPDGRAHVVAHSLGTLVAQQLAATAPERVRSLVLLGPVRAQGDAAKTATRARAATVREKGMIAVADSIVQNATAPAARAANPLVSAAIRELLLGQDAESYAQACEALASAENPDLAAITADTLLLAGEGDKVSPQATLDGMKAGLAGKTIEIATVADCGHWTVTEAPAFVAARTSTFLNEREAAAPRRA
jgi:pimeloyl-ACP methyl ester carboxylesterase